MKHLTTLLTMAITLTGIAQQMPYNPDANGDDFVGVDDVLGVLGVYDTALMNPEFSCDYQGTSFEQWLFDLHDETILLDSLYVEYTIVDSVETYLNGCPDPVYVETSLVRSYTFTGLQPTSDPGEDRTYEFYMTYLGYSRGGWFSYSPNQGTYGFSWSDWEIGEFFPDLGVYFYIFNQSIPLNENYILDEDGINLFEVYHPGIAEMQNFRMIPFWHEAE